MYDSSLNMPTSIPLAGVTAATPDRDCPDGQLDIALNLIPEDGALRPIPSPQLFVDCPDGCKPIFIHRISANLSTLIFASSSRLLWATLDTPLSTTLLSSEAIAPTSVAALGNTLIVATANAPIRYFLFKEGAYIDLGFAPPFPSIAFGCYQRGTATESTRTSIRNGADKYREFITGIINNNSNDNTQWIYSPKTEKFNGDDEAANEEIGQAAMGLLLSSAADNVTTKGFFYQPFFVRYALRLYDGSYAWHSAPILMLNNIIPPVVRFDSYVDPQLTLHQSLPYFGLAHFVFPDGLAKFSLWSDIVKGIDVFISAPIYTYDQSKNPTRVISFKYLPAYGVCRQKTDERVPGEQYDQSSVVGDDSDPSYFAGHFNHLHTNTGNYIDQLFSNSLFYAPNNITMADNNPVVFFEPNPNFLDEIRSAASGLFYKVASINIEDVKASSRFERLPLDHDDLSALTTKPRLPDDYRTHYGLLPNRLLNYNNRLHLANVNLNLPAAFPICSSLDFAGSSAPYISLAEASDTSDFASRLADANRDYGLVETVITVYSRHDGLTYKATAHGSIAAHTLFNSSLADYRNISSNPPRYIFVPDPGAFRLDVHYRNSSTGLLKLEASFPLKSHDTLNGAYYFAGLAPISTTADLPDVTTDPNSPLLTANSSLSTSPVPEHNKLYLSDAANPFVFPAAQVVSVGSADILAIASAAQPLSEGQFGQFPLYAFTSEGVWSLELSSSGSYSARQPICADVCSNPDGIAQLANSVAFPSARGILLLAGRSATCISAPLASDRPFDPDKLPSLSLLTPLSSLLTPSSSPNEFLADCRLAFDYRQQRLYAYSPSSSIAYVYSLRSNAWGMAVVDFTSTINAYPRALAVNSSGQIVDFSPIASQVSEDSQPSQLLISRPIKLGDPDTLKTISTLILRGDFLRSDASLILYASRDLVHWFVVRSSVNAFLRGFSGTPFKYFRIAAASSLAPDKSISAISVDFAPRLQNQLR